MHAPASYLRNEWTDRDQCERKTKRQKCRLDVERKGTVSHAYAHRRGRSVRTMIRLVETDVRVTHITRGEEGSGNDILSR